jgi:hypothetical protein
MLSVILNFESQQHNFEMSLALKQKAIFLETILYTHSPDKDTYCEVNSLPTRLKNAQQYVHIFYFFLDLEIKLILCLH